MNKCFKVLTIVGLAAMAAATAFAQTYPKGLIDKSIAVVGNEMISISTLEQEIQVQRMNSPLYSDKNMRCEILERLLESKLFLMQARVDSLKVNEDMVTSNLNMRIDQLRSQLGGDEEVEKYFNKPLYKLRQEWRKSLEEQSLFQQEQGQIAGDVPELTPNDVKEYIAATDSVDLPLVPVKYQLSQICIYPDREKANLAVKDRLLGLRERIIAGEKFSTLARIYSEDPGSARRGGELGMASKSIYVPAFADMAMSLKPGVISQIVETEYGFHIMEVIEKKGDMVNVRHILLKPRYTDEDRQKAFKTLDSLRTEINNEAVTFPLAARFYSQDPTTRTNGGQMADLYTGSAYFEIDQLKPADYNAIKNLKEGEISEPIESLDNEGQGHTVYKIIRVDKVVPAHTATFENDYNSLIEGVKNKKTMEAINSFVDKKIKETYIFIDPIFRECEFSREGWNWAAKHSED
ncbi:MAG: peptidylprolyl isomerase [Bacteroidales bacterium]|nr:peptidylprolyl isomerase [Bacteroidales bacterium]